MEMVGCVKAPGRALLLPPQENESTSQNCNQLAKESRQTSVCLDKTQATSSHSAAEKARS